MGWGEKESRPDLQRKQQRAGRGSEEVGRTGRARAGAVARHSEAAEPREGCAGRVRHPRGAEIGGGGGRKGEKDLESAQNRQSKGAAGLAPSSEESPAPRGLPGEGQEPNSLSGREEGQPAAQAGCAL